MNIKAVCKICGSQYMKRNGKSLYCSAECKSEATRLRQARWRKEHPDYHKKYYEEHHAPREQ